MNLFNCLHTFTYIHNTLFIHASLINVKLFFMRGVLTNYIINKYKKLHEGYKDKQVGKIHKRKNY